MPLPSRAQHPTAFWAAWLGVATFLVWVVPFVLTGLLDRAPGAWGHALSFSIGTVDPFEARGTWGKGCAVALAVVSWLLVPVLLGSAAALLVENAVQRSRPLTAEDVAAGIELIRAELDKLPPATPSPANRD